MQEKQLLISVLSDLNSSSGEIVASAVISTDGLPVAALLQSGVDPDRVGAMSAALLALSSRISRELQRGNLKQVIVEGEKGYVLLIQAGIGNVLAVTANENAKLGLILLDARRAAKSIVDICG
ncbi:roadblock/LC7 domain-containing protein [Stenoxybacter acetivorans]|uniref:roadblock/LC7 domain-containing protein n=1 Tax=Stenoxybacter acetivorans TaxID=422441 RepID=UPI00056090E3|nr:roadblock/LC7 domain-containing protein [Stenoxybacter acetivorans]